MTSSRTSDTFVPLFIREKRAIKLLKSVGALSDQRRIRATRSLSDFGKELRKGPQA